MYNDDPPVYFFLKLLAVTTTFAITYVIIHFVVKFW